MRAVAGGRDGPRRAARALMDGKVLALACAFCFGLNPIVLKVGFARAGKVDDAVLIGLGVAIPLYLALTPAFGGLRLEQVTLPALLGFVLGGIFGAGVGRRWLYLAIDRIGASPATAIKNSAPLVTTALAMLLLGERIALLQWAAVASIVAGISLVMWRAGDGLGRLLDVGVLAGFGAALSYGVRPLFLKFGLTEANLPLTAALVGAVAALVYVLALTRPRPRLDGLNRRALWLFLGAGFLQAAGFLALTLGLAVGDVSIVYPVTSTAPLFTLLFTWALLRGTERVTWRIGAGALAVVGGVIML